MDFGQGLGLSESVSKSNLNQTYEMRCTLSIY